MALTSRDVSHMWRFSGELDGNLNSIQGHNFGCPSLFLETAWEENTEDLMRGFHDSGLDLEHTISTTFNWQELGYMAPPDCKGNSGLSIWKISEGVAVRTWQSLSQGHYVESLAM